MRNNKVRALGYARTVDLLGLEYSEWPGVVPWPTACADQLRAAFWL